MTDEIRNEIIRLARKGWTADQILNEGLTEREIGQTEYPTEEQVQQVIEDQGA